MVPETPHDSDAVPETLHTYLLADKHPQQDLFLCDVADAVLKDVMQQMEHPFYSLSKKPVKSVREYRHGEHWLRVTPSVQGLATIYDKDILIYAISQLIAKRNRGEEVGPRVRIHCREFLIFTNRGTGGKDYTALVEALERLRGTTISTNIRTGDEEQIDVFGLIDTGTIRRKFGLNGRLLWVDIVLSDWVFSAIKANEVLTLSRDYFRLSKPYERRAYEIARKHCGRQEEWPISLGLLRKKMGATSPLKKFRYFIKVLAKHDHLPDYTVELTDTDQVIFRNRKAWEKEDETELQKPPLFRTTETYERAKRYIPPGQSVYEWEADWEQFWRDSGCPALKSADGAFIGYCKARFVRMNDRAKAQG